MTAGAVILAAGKGERMGGVDKAFVELLGIPMAAYSLRAFAGCGTVGSIALVVRTGMEGAAWDLVRDLRPGKPVDVVAGGGTRLESARAGPAALRGAPDFAAVHDAARPLAGTDLVSLCIEAAAKHGSGVAACRVSDTVLESEDGGATASRPADRSRLWATQTPQVFRRDILAEALDRAILDGALVTDEATAVRRIGGTVHLVEWRRPNFKITYREDAAAAAALLGAISYERRRDGGN